MAFSELDEDVSGNGETVAPVFGLFPFQVLLNMILSRSSIGGALYERYLSMCGAY